jgi:hypothetical protein
VINEECLYAQQDQYKSPIYLAPIIGSDGHQSGCCRYLYDNLVLRFVMPVRLDYGPAMVVDVFG